MSSQFIHKNNERISNGKDPNVPIESVATRKQRSNQQSVANEKFQRIRDDFGNAARYYGRMQRPVATLHRKLN